MNGRSALTKVALEKMEDKNYQVLSLSRDWNEWHLHRNSQIV
jgi:hypothetical protein